MLPQDLEVLGLQLEIALGMSTYRTLLGGLLADNDMTTVTAYPDAFAIA